MKPKMANVVLWSILAGLAVCINGPSFVRLLTPLCNVPVDFFQEWASARNFFLGRPIYTPHAVTVPAYLDSEHLPNKVDVNAHPPASVLMSLPFGLLDYTRALKLWNVLSLIALFFALRLIFQQLHRPWTPALVPAALVFVFSFPMRQHLENGQWSIFMLLLLTLCWRADTAKCEAQAGAALGLATALKMFPALLFVYFAAQRKWRTVAAGLLWFIGINLLTVLLLGVDTYCDYIERALPRLADWRSHPSNNSLPALWAKLFDPGTKEPKTAALLHWPELAAGATLFSLLAVVACVVWLAVGTRSREQNDLAFCLTCAAMLLVTPVAWQHYQVLLAGFLLLTWQRLQRRLWLQALFWVSIAILWLHPNVPWRIFDRLGLVDGSAGVTVAHLLCVGSLPLYAVLVLIGMTLSMKHDRQPVIEAVALSESRPVAA